MTKFNRALILVDLQNDFLRGGALAVPDGNLVLPIANRLADVFPYVAATQDWHPANHGSFASQHPGAQVGDVIELDGLPQILWPDHCVQHSHGAEFAAELRADLIHTVFCKGCDPRVDSYSGFYDNGHRHATGLGDDLRARKIKEIAVLGLATDYCVKLTVLDALREGFATSVVEDGCRAVELEAGDGAKALREMHEAGAKIVQSVDLPKVS